MNAELLKCDGCGQYFPQLFNFLEPGEMPGGGKLYCRHCHDAASSYVDDDDDDDHDGLDPDEHDD